MTTLKQLLEEKILCSDARTVILIVEEWLLQKRQEYINAALERDKIGELEEYALIKLQQDVIDFLLEELKQ